MNFQTDVIERSHTVPVVVDFWAAWCGPCKMLGPVIEALATEQAGRWELVKIDTEAQQELAARYGIRSIPNVKMFRNGEVVAEFAGALPKGQIEKWLDEHIPNPAKAELAKLLPEIAHFPDAAVQEQLQAYLAATPQLTEAKLALATYTVLLAPEEARELLEGIPLTPDTMDQLADIRQLAQFIQFEQQSTAKVEAELHLSQQAFRNGFPEEGIQHLIQATMYDKGFQDDLPRKTAIAFFRLWGNAHPLTRQYRRQFDMVLY
jgi:putative thioredoxin